MIPIPTRDGRKIAVNRYFLIVTFCCQQESLVANAAGSQNLRELWPRFAAPIPAKASTPHRVRQAANPG
jgi:hypothetical protein